MIKVALVGTTVVGLCLGGAFAVPASAHTVSPVSAAVVAKAKPGSKYGSLRVVLAGDAGLRAASVTGPKGFSRTLLADRTLKRLQPGRYTVSPALPAEQVALVTVTPSAKTVRIVRGKRKTVTLTFDRVVPPPVVAPPVVDTAAPGPVTKLAAVPGGTSVALTWDNPADADLAAVIVRRSPGAGPPAFPADGSPVNLATPVAAQAVDTSLPQETQYSYAVFTRDGSGNTSEPVTITTMTRDITAPDPVTLSLQPEVVSGTAGLGVSLGMPSSADLDKVLVWSALGAGTPDTSTAPTTVLTGPSPGTFSLSMVSDLQENSTYTYAAVAVDEAGNRSTVATATAVTPGIPPGPVTNIEVGASPLVVTLRWVNPTDPDFSHAIVRFVRGQTPPSTPTSGTAAGTTVNPLWMAQFGSSPLTYYSVSIFSVDTNGNINPTPTSVTFETPNGTGGGGR